MKKSFFQWIDYLVLITFLLLIRLPAAFGLQYDIRVRLLFLLPIIFVIWRRLVVFLTSRNPITFDAHKYYLLYVIYILLVTVAFARTILNESVDTSRALGNLFLLILGQAFIFGLSSQSKRPGEDLKKGIYLSLLVYISANLLMEVLNFSARNDIFATPHLSSLASYLGLEAYRTTFPTATGINSFGIVAGVLLVSSFLVMREKRFNPLLRASGGVGILTSLITLVFTDSRAASIFALLAIACSYIPYKFSRLLRYIPIVSVILPLLILGTLQRLSPSAIQVLSRNQSDALTLSNRTVIWEVAFDTLRESPENLLFGYGYRGQIVSGAMEKYEYLFGGYVGVFSIPLHNSFLQAVFEIGLVGTILFVLNLITLFVLLDRERQLQNSPWATVLYFTLLFLSLISSTDSVLSFDNQESYIIFMFIATVSFFSLAKEKN